MKTKNRFRNWRLIDERSLLGSRARTTYLVDLLKRQIPRDLTGMRRTQR